MRFQLIITFLIGIMVITPNVLSQIQYYGIDVELEESGKTSIKLIISFIEPRDKFVLVVFGQVNNFDATSNAGEVNCSINVKEASYIDCSLPLTQEKRTLEINFDTNDLVKTLDNKYIFSGDFSLNQNIQQISASVKLPEGFAIAEDNETKIVNPKNVVIVSDGRKIIANWNLENSTSTDTLKFQIVYEKLKSGFPINPMYFVLIFVTIVIIGFFILRKIRKPQEVILSVLDEYEKKVMQVIDQAGGEINQRKVVQQTNLSKAKVSRVVKSLVERGLIETERMGRTNRLKIIKKKIWS